eukprot:TRINITY_DN24138_c0_g2_i1.p1 TRINITY_DN24138_c0_g2~~TRINITY_DN24138_c0_g2_i1.p1  ORF type:complete len:121 (+),score=1.31 TRINITY_DN24138_c0_g2_i1:379-741(+)
MCEIVSYHGRCENFGHKITPIFISFSHLHLRITCIIGATKHGMYEPTFPYVNGCNQTSPKYHLVSIRISCVTGLSLYLIRFVLESNLTSLLSMCLWKLLVLASLFSLVFFLTKFWNLKKT